MATIKTKDGTEIFYKDWGTGQPIVFHHGWPLSGDDWDAQLLYFLDKGYRVIAHDRMAARRRRATVTTWITTPPTLPPWSSILS
jgi:non-heme chloroperoxidase